MPQYNTREIQNQYLSIKESGSVSKDSGSTDLTFRSNIDSNRVSIYLNNQYKSVEDISCQIQWRVDIDARSYGIKNIDVLVDKLIMTFSTVPATDDPLSGDEREDITIKYDRSSSEWELKTSIKAKDFLTIYPQEVEVDYKDKTITILF